MGKARLALVMVLLGAASALAWQRPGGARAGGSDQESPAAASVRSEEGRVSARKAVLLDADGQVIGQASFLRAADHQVSGVIAIDFATFGAGFHAIHLHANDDPANGEGCIADPDQPPEEHFLSADDHYNPDGVDHGEHAGDLPSVRILSDGRGFLSFVQDIDLDALDGLALVLHADRDNFGHVPVGQAPDDYRPNSKKALELTRTAGHTGHRIACGVIR